MHCKRLIRTACVLLLVIIVVFVKPVDATTWSVNITRVTTDTGYDGYAAITQMSDGELWIVWSKAILGNLTLHYKTSPDLGTTWSDEMNLTKLLAPGNNQNPSIIQAENETIWLVWTSDRPPEPQGPLPPQPDFYLNATPASLTIPPGGSDNSTISVTGINNFTDTVTLYASLVPNVTSTLDPTAVFIPVNGTTTSNLTVSVDATATPGNYTLTVMGEPHHHQLIHGVHIALEIPHSTASSSGVLSHPSSLSSSPEQIQDYEIFLKTSHDNGATWSNATQLTDDSTDDLRPSIIQLTNGTFMLIWQSNRLGNHDIFYMTTSNGASWSDPRQLTTDPDRDKGPHLTETEDGRIWVVWASMRTGDYEIFYKSYDGLSWSADERLTDSADTDVTPSILQAIDGTIYVFWCSMPASGGADIYYKYSSDDGATWSDSIRFTTDKDEDMWPSVTRTYDTKVWVVWTSNRADQPDGNWDVYYRTSLPGDVNEDGFVDIWDLSLASVSYGYFEWEPEYNPDADLNKDGVVDMRDLTIIALNYGAT